MDNFDDLTPEQFSTPVETSGVAEPYDANQTFDQFVRGHVSAVRYTFNRNGWAQMYAHLVAGGTQWRFGPIAPETLDEFRDRLHDEAQRLDARMLFVNRRTTGGVFYADSEDERINLDPTSPQALKQVQEAGTARDIMFYFAHRIHLGGQSEFRHGVMDVVDGQLAEPVEGLASAGGGYYAKILR